MVWTPGLARPYLWAVVWILRNWLDLPVGRGVDSNDWLGLPVCRRVDSLETG
jgi:hypothetical protein